MVDSGGGNGSEEKEWISLEQTDNWGLNPNVTHHTYKQNHRWRLIKIPNRTQKAPESNLRVNPHCFSFLER